jgi:hypothetical protein
MKWPNGFPSILDLRPPALGSKGRLKTLRDGTVVIVSGALFFSTGRLPGVSNMWGMSFVLLFSRQRHDASIDACRVGTHSARGGKGNRRSSQGEVKVHAKEQ